MDRPVATVFNISAVISVASSIGHLMPWPGGRGAGLLIRSGEGGLISSNSNNFGIKRASASLVAAHETDAILEKYLARPLLDTTHDAHLGLPVFIRSIRLCRFPAFMICTPLTGTVHDQKRNHRSD